MAAPNQFGFIHLTSHGLVSTQSQCSWVMVKAGKCMAQGQGNLQQAATACAKLPTALALSVHDLVLTKLTLPTKSQSQRRTAIPYAMQSQLAAPASELHWSWRAKGQQLQLVGIAQTHLSAINASLQALHFAPRWLLADGLHLGGHESQWQVMVLPHSLLLQQAAHSACCIASQSPSSWLQKAYSEAQKSAAGEPLNIHITGPIDPALDEWLSSLSVSVKSAYSKPPKITGQAHQLSQEFNSASVLAPYFDAKTCINLWPRKPPKMRIPTINWLLWRLPYKLTVMLILLGLGHLWLNNMSTTKTIETNYQRGVAIFQGTLPNTRLVDPLSQLQAQVLGLKKPQQRALYMPMLQAFQRLQEATNPATDISARVTKIRAIEFVDQKLQVNLEASLKDLKQWPKTGRLEAGFNYQTKLLGPEDVRVPTDTNEANYVHDFKVKSATNKVGDHRLIMITLSFLEAR